MFWIHGTRYKRAPAGDLPIVDNHSLIDACWIKAYNGVPQNHFYYLDEGDEFEGIPTQWRIDVTKLLTKLKTVKVQTIMFVILEKQILHSINLNVIHYE